MVIFHGSQRKANGEPRRVQQMGDYLIICGDFCLFWLDDVEFKYNLDWMSRLPFMILWTQGNHENHDMIEQYPIEFWNGGKVRKILNNVILMERGQIFTIDGNTFFTFGGAASTDVEGGILDRNDIDYYDLMREAESKELSYRVKHLSWWEQELPTEEEMQAGRVNSARANYHVDYVITHCASTEMQNFIMKKTGTARYFSSHNTADRLTDYLSELEHKLTYKHWYFGHYHFSEKLDAKHTILYKDIIPLE